MKPPFLYSDNLRHFTDHLILARQEAEEEEGKAALEMLTDTHIIQTLSDIFLGETLRKKVIVDKCLNDELVDCLSRRLEVPNFNLGPRQNKYLIQCTRWFHKLVNCNLGYPGVIPLADVVCGITPGYPRLG